MLAELRSRSQITLPESIVASLGLQEGDMLDISENNGVIHMIPVIAYPQKYIKDLKHEISQLKENIQSGSQPVFSTADELIENLEKA